MNQLAHGLAARGLHRGDALGVASGNSAEFLAVYFACAKLGLVCVPVNLSWRPEEAAYVLDHAGRGSRVARPTGRARVLVADRIRSATCTRRGTTGSGRVHEA